MIHYLAFILFLLMVFPKLTMIILISLASLFLF
jgi:hypothetical protein